MKILAINNAFCSPTIGGIRARLLVRELARRGHVLTVLVSAGSRLEEPMERVELVQVHSLDFERILQFFKPSYSGENTPSKRVAGKGDAIKKAGGIKKWLNRWCMVPDKVMPWILPAVRVGGKLLKQENFDIIYATTPARSNLLAGALLARKSDTPLTLEYRDLWTDNPYQHFSFPTGFHRRLHRYLERFALKQASQITAVCKGIQAILQNKVENVHALEVGLNYNFFDPAVFGNVRARTGEERFSIVYVGSLYYDRQPRVFFEGMRLFLDQYKLSPSQFGFDCVGRCYGIGDIEGFIRKVSVVDYVEFVGQVSHQDATQRLRDANACLIVQPPVDEMHIPAKLYEALGSGTPILLISPECETADILKRCNSGIACGHTPESVADGIGKLYDQWKSGVSWLPNKAEIDEFSVEKAAVHFEALLGSALMREQS